MEKVIATEIGTESMAGDQDNLQLLNRDDYTLTVAILPLVGLPGRRLDIRDQSNVQ
jgi:hypothetical protein